MAPYKSSLRLNKSSSKSKPKRSKPKRGPRFLSQPTPRQSGSAYELIGKLVNAGKEFDKQIQLFMLHGESRHQITLSNGDIVEKGDCIEIDQGKDYSKTSYKGERWFAKITEIKGEGQQCYLLCYWFYSELNVNRLGVTVGNLLDPSRTRCPFSWNELVLSNHQQLLLPETVLSKINIRLFNELDRDQEPIGLKELWYRFNLRVGPGIASTRLVQGTNSHLPPARCSVETCSIRYKPDEHHQRLCPRPSCGFWYHERCLMNLGFLVDKKEIPASQRLPAMLYATEECMSWIDDDGREYEHLPPIFYAMLAEGVIEEKGGDEPIFPLHDQDEVGSICNIIWCAQTPIKRGCSAGVVGNEAIVKKARELLRGTVSMPPPKSARLPKGKVNQSPYENLEELGFEKKIQVFGIYGVERSELRLPNGDVVVKGDCVEIKQGYDHSNTSYDGERWFAEVAEIKGESYNVGHKELMLSDHKQVFAPENIIRKVNVRFFDELERKQPQIGDYEYWYRFNLRIGKGPMDTRVAQGKKRHLPPARCAIETCELGRYKPDEHIQILCPREGCEFWYHEQCLAARGFIVSSEKEIRNRLRNILHGTPEFMFVKDGCREHIPEEWYATFNSGILEERGGDEPFFPEYEQGSVSNILWCAQRSIRRGGMNGIVGNEAVVTKARSLVREIIDYWSSNLWPSEEDTALFEEFHEPKDPTYYCVRCNSII
ncbi:BAH domain protein [Ceratobasidium sp. AG-Ba]|nr:BAH domain protein [Ceratobasidium sp. AG-Ba]QRW04359.1 BAH domain protein [Ceratobasidium sp. AG-Ba]